MLDVYVVHVYGDKMSHVDKIKRTMPDKIILFANEEYDVHGIFKDFVDELYPWLIEHNKTVDILAPGFDRQINDRVFVHKSYGYQLMNRIYTVDRYSHMNFNNVHEQADKLYTLYCNRGSFERMKIIDTFAREKMIDQGIVTFKGVYYFENFNELWEYHDGSPLIDEEGYNSINNSRIEYEPNSFPRSFFRGLVDVVCESRVDDLEFFATEKTAKSLIAQKPFLALSCQHYHRYLQEEYGIELYTELFDYSFDSCKDVNDRIEGIVSNVKNIMNMDKNTLHSLVFDKLVHNKRVFENYIIDHNKMVPSVLQFVNEVPYTLHGDDYIMLQWLDYGKQHGYVK